MAARSTLGSKQGLGEGDRRGVNIVTSRGGQFFKRTRIPSAKAKDLFTANQIVNEFRRSQTHFKPQSTVESRKISFSDLFLKGEKVDTAGDKGICLL